VFHIAERHAGLLPDDADARARAITWMFAALNTVEPAILELATARLLEGDKPWSKERQVADSAGSAGVVRTLPPQSAFSAMAQRGTLQTTSYYDRSRLLKEQSMEDAQIGWIGAIIIGGIAGWLAEVVTRSNMGIIANVILGVIGAGFASWLFGKLGIQIGGPDWLGYFVAGFVGAFILILATRIFYPDRWRA
jgi:uncharacterized membrane protein YeaQ/YmgE (transglycosylase-associated protein family)